MYSSKSFVVSWFHIDVRAVCSQEIQEDLVREMAAGLHIEVGQTVRLKRVISGSDSWWAKISRVRSVSLLPYYIVYPEYHSWVSNSNTPETTQDSSHIHVLQCHALRHINPHLDLAYRVRCCSLKSPWVLVTTRQQHFSSTPSYIGRTLRLRSTRCALVQQSPSFSTVATPHQQPGTFMNTYSAYDLSLVLTRWGSQWNATEALLDFCIHAHRRFPGTT